MFITKSKITLAFLGLLLSLSASAQLVVQTTVMPPYSPYLSDYYGYKEKMTVRIVNPTQTTYQVRLQGNITGPNNINLSTKQGFKPAQSINVPPGITNIKGGQLSAYFTDGAMSFSGISKQEIINGNGLPEGNYKICFWATQYNSNQNLSAPNQGCSNIHITHFETPKLNIPVCDAEITAKNPQNVVFNWTMPAGVMPSDIQYELTVVEVNPSGLNATQAIESATEPIFFRKTVQVNNYIYNLSDPKLEIGKTYAWRVRAQPKLGKHANFKNNGYSVACKFKYDAFPKNDNEEEEPEDFNLCEGECQIAEPKNKDVYQPVVNDDIKIGRFEMKITSINGGSGTGIIHIPFLNVNTVVNFTNLKVNTDKVAYGSTKMVAKVANDNLVDQLTANDPNGEMEITADKMQQIENYIAQGNKLVSSFNENMEPIPVPFAQDKNGLNWDIVGLIFTPTGAYMNAVFGMEIPAAFDNNWVNMGKKGMCIRPNGYETSPKIYLAEDKIVKVGQFTDLVFKGNKTHFQLGCDGIQQVTVDGEFVVSREKLLPHDGKGIVQGESNKVRSSFAVNYIKKGGWIIESTVSPAYFVLPEASDVLLSADNLVIDMSDIENAESFNLHKEHNKSAAEKDWVGLYFKQVKATLPSEFKKGNDPIQVTVADVVIDKTGLWMDASATNLLDISDGDVGGWRLSITSFKLDVQASSIKGGAMSGALELPIAKSGIMYDAALSKGNDGLNYLFAVGNVDELKAEVWLADLSLKPGSKISLVKKNGKVTPLADLNGSISISFSEKPDQETLLSNVGLNNIEFQSLKITGGNVPTVNVDFVSLKSQDKNEQHSMNKFPINLTKLAFDNKGNQPGIIFGMGLNLVKGSNGIAAETAFKIKGKYNPNEKYFEYNGIDLQSIGIDAQMGCIDLQGNINLYSKDNTYGTGFRGDISATVKVIGVAIDATLQVGKIGDGKQENNQNFRYWFADMSARWNKGGIVVPGAPAIAFYGFSGGAYKNMERAAAKVISNKDIPDIQGVTKDMTPGKSRSGVLYTPLKGSAGFMAGVTIGTAGEPTAFNADVKLLVEFNSDEFAIKKIVLDGQGYIMSPLLNREQNVLQVAVLIETDFDKPSFDLNATVDGGFNQSKLDVTVAASLNVHADPDNWWVKLGYWTNEDEPWNDPKRIQIDAKIDSRIAKAALNFNGYFMMGNDIGELPKSPLKVRNMLAQLGKPDNSNTIPSEVTYGSGFALGAGVRFTADLDYSIFYTDLEFILGGDVILSKKNLACNGKNDYGLNQWYAKGNAYGYFDVDAGVRLNMWLWKGEFSLVQFQTASNIQIEMPNPYWLKGKFALTGSLFEGRIKINSQYNMEIGEKCEWSPTTNIKDFPIVEELRPENGDKTTVFAAPQASFNFEMNKIILLKDKKGKKKLVKFTLISAKLNKGSSSIAGKVHWNNAKNGITFIASDVLPEKSTLTFKVVVKAEEYKNGKWVVIRNETKETSFETDIKPDHVAKENVIKAYPQIGQRYFLQDDQPTGDINVGMSQCYLLEKKSDKEFNYTYKLRYTNVENGQYQDVAFMCDNTNFKHTIPTLNNETVYEIKMLRIATPQKSKINTGKNTKSVYTNLKGIPVNYTPQKSGNVQINGNKLNLKYSNAKMVSNKTLNSNQGSTESILLKKNKVAFDQSTSGTIEKVLFAYHFRTSRYNTSAAKYGNHFTTSGFGNMQYEQTGFGYDWKTSVPFPLVHGKENMDIYDAYGYNKTNFNIYVDPLVKLNIDWGNTGWFQDVNSNVYGAKYKDYQNKTVNICHFESSNRWSNIWFFGRTDLLFSQRPKEAIKVWSPYTEGPINLASNQKILKPKGKLTNYEINQAKNGQKLNETVGVNYVIPLTDYSSSVVVLDAIRIYLQHKIWCNNDHTLNYKEKQCYEAEAYPLLKGKMLSKMINNPYSVLPYNQTLKYNMTYGYSAQYPFTKTFQFHYK